MPCVSGLGKESCQAHHSCSGMFGSSIWLFFRVF
jgi:hypothetical protein